MKLSKKPAKLNTQQQAGSRNTHSNKQEPKSGLPASRAFLIYALTSIIFGFILELALKHNFVQGYYIFKGYRWLVGLIFSGLIIIFYDMYKDDSILTAPFAFDANPWADMFERIVHFSKKVWQNALCVLLIGIILWTTTAVAWAKFEAGARIRHAGWEFLTYDSSTSHEGESNISSSEQPAEQNAGPVEPSTGIIPTAAQISYSNRPETVKSPVADANNSPSHSGLQNSFVDASERAIAEKAQHMQLCLPTMDWTISSEARDSLLFYSGAHAIPSDCTFEQARKQIMAHLRSLEQEQLSNIFDTQASQSLKDDIAYASQHDSALRTSVEKDLIIKTRLDAYTLFGKETLAKLLAEDFHCYALAYKYYNEDWDTMVNYYFQSLKWLYECLKYTELTEERRQEILISIRYRYNDIMTYSEWESEQWVRAKLLADVFNEIIADPVE